jgi:hypothetical protein
MNRHTANSNISYRSENATESVSFGVKGMLPELCTFSNFENETERTDFSSSFLAG